MQKINLPKTGINQPTNPQKTTRPLKSVSCFLLQTTKGENTMIIKKMFLALIIAAMTTMAAFAQSNENQTSVKSNGPNAATPAGSWMGVVTNDAPGPPPFRVLMTFTGAGGFVGSGDGDNSVGSPQYGVWERVGSENSRVFALTFHQLFSDANGNSTGSVKVRQTVFLGASGNDWHGPFTVEIFAPDGTSVFTGTGRASATRIQSEPLL